MMAGMCEILGTFYFRQPWPAWVKVLLVLGAVAVAVMLYLQSRTLATWMRVILGTLRAVLLILILLLLFEPVSAQTKRVRVPSNVLVLVDVSESMSIADDRKTSQEQAEVALGMGKSAKDVPSSPSRLDLARGILQNPSLQFLRDPGTNQRIRLFSFGDRLEAGPDEPADVAKWLAGLKADAPSTRLGDALQQAVERYSGQPISSIIVLTDGGSNEGADPLETARQLHVPVHTIGIGLPHPDDVRIVTVNAPEAVFPKERVPIRVQLDSTPGFVGRDTALTVKAAGQEVARKAIKLSGAGQFEELSFVPDKAQGGSDVIPLEITIEPLPGEVTEENNHSSRSVKIINDKIKVLYVEGRPRWEFRYLRAVLQRDPRMVVKFLMTEGDKDLAKAAPEQYIPRFPEEESAALQYDLVILGDVAAEFFTPKQLEWLEKLVRERGGSLLMIAGDRYTPGTYADSPVAKLLPVKIPGAGRESVDSSVFPFVTPAGKQSMMMTLSPDLSADDNQQAWSLVRPLFNVPRLDGAKPGATVLATLSDRSDRPEPYPLIAWQRYGTGKSMYVGTDKLWRMRFKRGDEYHAAFWGQAAQFLTLSRLLGENKRVRLETDKKAFRTGERVLIQANVFDSEYHPVKAEAYSVVVESVPPKGEPREIVLRRVPVAEGLYQGYFTADQPGNFEVVSRLEDPRHVNKADFQVETINREKLDPAMQKEFLQKLAELSGGKYVRMEELSSLGDSLPDQSRVLPMPPQEMEMWNNWAVLAAVLCLAGTEWFVRRRNDVA
jgi:hypothetical protein